MQFNYLSCFESQRKWPIFVSKTTHARVRLPGYYSNLQRKRKR
jgi:hypothetical protein